MTGGVLEDANSAGCSVMVANGATVMDRATAENAGQVVDAVIGDERIAPGEAGASMEVGRRLGADRAVTEVDEAKATALSATSWLPDNDSRMAKSSTVHRGLRCAMQQDGRLGEQDQYGCIREAEDLSIRCSAGSVQADAGDDLCWNQDYRKPVHQERIHEHDLATSSAKMHEYQNMELLVHGQQQHGRLESSHDFVQLQKNEEDVEGEGHRESSRQARVEQRHMAMQKWHSQYVNTAVMKQDHGDYCGHGVADQHLQHDGYEQQLPHRSLDAVEPRMRGHKFIRQSRELAQQESEHRRHHCIQLQDDLPVQRFAGENHRVGKQDERKGRLGLDLTGHQQDALYTQGSGVLGVWDDHSSPQQEAQVMVTHLGASMDGGIRSDFMTSRVDTPQAGDSAEAKNGVTGRAPSVSTHSAVIRGYNRRGGAASAKTATHEVQFACNETAKIRRESSCGEPKPKALPADPDGSKVWTQRRADVNSALEPVLDSLLIRRKEKLEREEQSVRPSSTPPNKNSGSSGDTTAAHLPWDGCEPIHPSIVPRGVWYNWSTGCWLACVSGVGKRLYVFSAKRYGYQRAFQLAVECKEADAAGRHPGGEGATAAATAVATLTTDSEEAGTAAAKTQHRRQVQDGKATGSEVAMNGAPPQEVRDLKNASGNSQDVHTTNLAPPSERSKRRRVLSWRGAEAAASGFFGGFAMPEEFSTKSSRPASRSNGSSCTSSSNNVTTCGGSSTSGACCNTAPSAKSENIMEGVPKGVWYDSYSKSWVCAVEDSDRELLVFCTHRFGFYEARRMAISARVSLLSVEGIENEKFRVLPSRRRNKGLGDRVPGPDCLKSDALECREEPSYYVGGVRRASNRQKLQFGNETEIVYWPETNPSDADKCGGSDGIPAINKYDDPWERIRIGGVFDPLLEQGPPAPNIIRRGELSLAERQLLNVGRVALALLLEDLRKVCASELEGATPKFVIPILNGFHKAKSIVQESTDPVEFEPIFRLFGECLSRRILPHQLPSIEQIALVCSLLALVKRLSGTYENSFYYGLANSIARFPEEPGISPERLECSELLGDASARVGLCKATVCSPTGLRSSDALTGESETEVPSIATEVVLEVALHRDVKIENGINGAQSPDESTNA